MDGVLHDTSKQAITSAESDLLAKQEPGKNPPTGKKSIEIPYLFISARSEIVIVEKMCIAHC